MKSAAQGDVKYFCQNDNKSHAYTSIFFREHTLFSVGASHHDDTLYVFRQSFNFPVIETSSPDSHVVDELTAIWYNFARYGYVFIFRRQR